MYGQTPGVPWNSTSQATLLQHAKMSLVSGESRDADSGDELSDMSSMNEKNEALSRLRLLLEGLWIPREVSYVTLQKSVLLCLEHMATDPASQAAGVSILCDSAGFTLDKLFSCNIGLLRRFLEYVQDCMPMRLKAVHIIRESKAMDLLFVLLRPFIKRKLAQRIHFHGASYGKLYEDLPPSVLPEEYGGETEPYDCESFWNQMDSEEAAFVKNNEFGYFGAKPKRRSSR
ncbi:alpha-tocopherol transfer protein-like isoform X3 [Haemaphysalis longicornis]